ncbi:hypothetical protein VPH35_028762 [Triticum aestivum]
MAWRRALGTCRTLLFLPSSPQSDLRSGPCPPLVAGSAVDGAAGGVVTDQEKSLAGFLATTTATPPGAVFLLGGSVEVRLPPSLPLACPSENSILFRLGCSNVSCVAIFLKVPPWLSWGCAGAMGVVVKCVAALQVEGVEGLNLLLISAGAVLLSAFAALNPLLASSSSTSLKSSFSSLGVDYCVLTRLFIWCS